MKTQGYLISAGGILSPEQPCLRVKQDQALTVAENFTGKRHSITSHVYYLPSFK